MCFSGRFWGPSPVGACLGSQGDDMRPMSKQNILSFDFTIVHHSLHVVWFLLCVPVPSFTSSVGLFVFRKTHVLLLITHLLHSVCLHVVIVLLFSLHRFIFVICHVGSHFYCFFETCWFFLSFFYLFYLLPFVFFLSVTFDQYLCICIHFHTATYANAHTVSEYIHIDIGGDVDVSQRHLSSKHHVVVDAYIYCGLRIDNFSLIFKLIVTGVCMLMHIQKHECRRGGAQEHSQLHIKGWSKRSVCHAHCWLRDLRCASSGIYRQRPTTDDQILQVSWSTRAPPHPKANT